MGYDVAIVGTGADPEKRSRHGYAMAYRHARAYENRDDCRVAACVDLNPENVTAFARSFGIEMDHVFTDHRTMLSEVEPDIVSVCVPPSAHAEIVLDCARAGGVSAIHCEKPMATTWRDCQEMVRVCDRAGVQLTIGHQRRFAKPVQRAKQLLDDGEIGELRRIEWAEVNLFDAGSHLFDLCDLFVDGASPSWVLAAVDTSERNEWFGTRNSTQALAQWEYETGVQGFASTADGDHRTLVDAYLRLVGDDGVIEIEPDHGAPLQLRTNGDWEVIDCDGERLYGPVSSTVGAAMSKMVRMTPGLSSNRDTRPNYRRAIDHAVDAVDGTEEPIHSGRAALRGTELIFGAWESARQRGRVPFPLEIEDNPLEAIIGNGAAAITMD